MQEEEKEVILQEEENHNVLYVCDRRRCGENHICGECRHTTDIKHAVNFEERRAGYYKEKFEEIHGTPNSEDNPGDYNITDLP